MFRSSRLCRLCLIEVNAVVPIFATKDVAETSSIQMKIMELANVQVYAGDGLPSNVCSNCNTLLDSYHAFKTQIEKSDVILRHQLSTSQTDPLSLDGKEVEGTGHGEFVKAETLIIKDEEIDEDHVESIIHPTSAPSLSSPLPDTSIINDDEDEDENEDDDDGDDHDNDPGADEMDVDDDETQTDPLASDPVESPLDQLSTSNKPATSVADANVTTPQSIPLVTSTSSIPLVSSATPIIANPPGNLLLVATPLIINSGNEPGKPNSVTPTSSFVALPTNVSSTFVTVPTSAIKAPTPTATVTSGSIKKKPKRKTTVKKEKVSEVSAEPGPSTSTAEPTEESASTSAGGDPLQVLEYLDLCYGNEGNSFVTDLNASKFQNKAKRPIKRLKNVKNNTRKKVSESKGDKNIYCDICKRIIPHNYSRHKKYVHGKDIAYTPCKICGKLLKRSDYVSIHMKRVHSDYSKVPLLKCDICGKELKNMDRLKNHKKIVHIDLQVPCTMCDKKFKNHFNLTAHIKSSHSNDTLHICPICGKSVKFIDCHMKVMHTEHISVTCDICGKTYPSERHLKLHKNYSHSENEKIHMCEICGASFQLKVLLKGHYVVHSNERKYKCDICNKTFKLRSVLRTHQRVHNAVDPYVCNKCGDTFKWKQTFDKHLVKCAGDDNVVGVTV